MKVSTILQFILVVMVCNAHVVICSSLYGNETDRLALLDFKNSISFDPQQALMSWNDSTHFCNWEGVLCRVKTPHRVTSLNLTNRDLVGQISPSLGNLTFLKFLILPKNSFTGEIPASLGYLHRLETLYLSNNTLQGRIPNLSNCSNLMVLDLLRNNLVGQFPVDLPHRLQSLQLSFNNLTGAIPASLANITTLYKLRCGANNFEGNIPNEFAKFPVLQFLEVGINKLVGRFPQAVLNLSTLLGVGLAFNDLSGEVASNLGDALPNLEVLLLDGNFFQGHIPYSLVNTSKLFHLDISRNNFTGVIPSSIGKLTKLVHLNLELNKLEARNKQDWEFMNSLANCTELQGISVAGNRLEGLVPNSLGNLSAQLVRLLLDENQLSGGFPSGIKNLANLTYLSLATNQFTGFIPEWLGTLKSLQDIELTNNMFTGFIPTSLSNLSRMGFLLLGSNKFNGHIPPSLGNLQMLEEMSVTNNNLHGSVPKEIFRIPSIMRIDLSFNNLEGRLPADIGNARQLVNLQLSSNKLSGDIPNTLGNCESLEDIKLDWNFFSGSIPNSLGTISSLKVLNLSHNNLTGSIPVSLGNLQILQQLDLSFNRFKGEVPTIGLFKNATAIQIDGNQALCGGAPELHLLSCSIMPLNSTKRKQSIVLKTVIPLASLVSIAIVISVLFLWRGKQKTKSIYLPSFDSKFPKVSYGDLARATNGFSTSNLIGRGRYSSVYQGALFQDRNVVAVKVFSLETRGAQKSFIAECNALRNVRHHNLVPILTACSSIDAKGNDFKALVYEFMPRGDLHELLYSTRDDETSSTSNHITLAQRLSIVVGVADALEYLHHNNQGTIGYVAPEYASGGQVSTAADVYSFGIALLEIFLRKRPTDDMFKDGLNIANFVEMNFPDRILQIVDPVLLQDQQDFSQETPVAMKEKGSECLLSVLNIGLSCTKPSPNERMDMQEVAARLHGIKEAYLRVREY